MKNKFFLRIFIACILTLTAMATSCAERSSGITTQPIDTTSKLNLAHADKDMQPSYNDFKMFYNAFSRAVHRNDWARIAELTRFPFVLKGELDSEGKVSFDKNRFIQAIGELLKDEIYVNINDNLIATNYLKVISDLGNYLRSNDNEAQLFGMLFIKTIEGWKLSEITTHVHIVEKYTGIIQ